MSIDKIILYIAMGIGAAYVLFLVWTAFIVADDRDDQYRDQD